MSDSSRQFDGSCYQDCEAAYKACKSSREHFDFLVDLGAAPDLLYIGHADFDEFDKSEHVCKNGGHLIFTVWDVDYMIPDKLMNTRFADLVQKGYVNSMLMSVDFALMKP